MELKNDGNTLNRKSVSKMKSLVNAGSIDFDSAWSFSSSDGNALLGPDGDNWTQYENAHLGINSDAKEGTKARYSYPIAKLKGGKLTIFRKAVIAAKAAAAGARGAEKNTEIFNAADSLLSMIDEKQEDACATKKKKRGDVIREKRIDFYDIMPGVTEELNGMESKFELDENGFLKGRAIITNIGVFPYRMPDGTIRRELRLPEDVMSPEHLNSLKMLIVTNDHPDMAIDINNAKELQVGMTGDSVFHDPYHISIPIKITDKETIQEVKNGKRGLSLGYHVDIEMKSGNFMGVAYDVIQRNHFANHLAIVDRGRAGDAARIRMDCAVGIDVVDGSTDKSINMEDSMSDKNLKIVKIDGVDYSAEAEVIKSLNKTKKDADGLQSKLDELNSNYTKLEAEKDTLSDRVDQLEKELEKAKADAMDEAKIQAAVNSRLSLIKTANDAKVEVKEDDSAIEIKKAVILKIFPNANLEEKSDDYISARFDSAVEMIEVKLDADETAKNKDAKKREELNGDKGAEDGEEKFDSEKAREKMVTDIQKRSRGQE